MKVKSTTRKRLSENAEALRYALRARARSFDSLVKNEVCRVTRYHDDGRREILHVPVQRFYFEKFLPAKQLSADDVKQVRVCWNINQLQMARRLKVPVASLRKWEQGLELPTGKVARLLQVMCTMMHPG